MHTTSGLVLDTYDDVGGTQFKDFFPSLEVVPDFVKQAHALSSAERDRLPDDAFALVLINGEETLRKYACIDEGNTALSVVYFLKNASKLPDIARQRCAENLKVACGWYHLEVPEELEKAAGVVANLRGAAGAGLGVGKALAGVAVAPVTAAAGAAKFLANPVKGVAANPVGAAMTAMTAPSLARGTMGAIKENLQKVREGEMMGGVAGGMERMASANLEHLQLLEGFKVAEMTGTPLMAASVAPTTPTTTLAGTIKKTSSVGRLVPGHGRGTDHAQSTSGVVEPVTGTAPVRAPQHMNPVVVVTGQSASETHKEKKASRFAMPSKERYPLDSYAQVKTAAVYFEEFGQHMQPAERHEYCVNLSKRASELLISLPADVNKYGSETYAPAEELKVAFAIRRNLISDPEDLQTLDKLASATDKVHPEDFVRHLEMFDKIAGLAAYYGHVPDAYYSVFGREKVARDEASWSDVVGNFHITGHELKTFALNHWMKLKKTFGMEFAEEFRKDPIGIYSSMPVEQKTLIIRLATENAI